MPVTSQCQPDAVAVVVRSSAGHKLRHTVKESEGVRFTLEDDQGNTLLSDASPVRERMWPLSGDYVPPANGAVTHALGMVFGAAGKVRWEVDVLTSDGAVEKEVKHCTYENVGAADSEIAAIRIRVS